jgi:hypothetical protein
MLVATTPRDPIGDHLLTPQNAAMVRIDYQPSQFALVQSMDRDLLLEKSRLDGEDREAVRRPHGFAWTGLASWTSPPRRWSSTCPRAPGAALDGPSAAP